MCGGVYRFTLYLWCKYYVTTCATTTAFTVPQSLDGTQHEVKGSQQQPEGAQQELGRTQQLEEAQQELKDAEHRKQLQDTKQQLVDTKLKLEDTKQQLEDAKQQLDDAKQVANLKEQQLTDSLAKKESCIEAYRAKQEELHKVTYPLVL